MWGAVDTRPTLPPASALVSSLPKRIPFSSPPFETSVLDNRCRPYLFYLSPLQRVSSCRLDAQKRQKSLKERRKPPLHSSAWFHHHCLLRSVSRAKPRRRRSAPRRSSGRAAWRRRQPLVIHHRPSVSAPRRLSGRAAWFRRQHSVSKLLRSSGREKWPGRRPWASTAHRLRCDRAPRQWRAR